MLVPIDYNESISLKSEIFLTSTYDFCMINVVKFVLVYKLL